MLANMTVRENLELGAYRRPAGETRAAIAAMEKRFPILGERRKSPAGTLSGGEQQMLAIARGLMAKPKLLLLDEPSLGLAPLLVQTIFEIVGELHSEGLTILLVEQNAHQALMVSSHGYVMESGKDRSRRLGTAVDGRSGRDRLLPGPGPTTGVCRVTYESRFQLLPLQDFATNSILQNVETQSVFFGYLLSFSLRKCVSVPPVGSCL